MALWSITAYILVFSVIENVMSTISDADQAINNVPLSRSLGFTIRKNIGKTLEDRIGEEYITLYNEMHKASQETVGRLGDRDDFEVGTDLTKLKGVVGCRRSSRANSPIKQRRARSQALRLEKLNSQSLRSHMEHSRHSNLEQREMI